MKRLAWYTAVILATLTVLFLFWEFQIAIILFILSLTVAAILRPLVDNLSSRGLPRGISLVITYLAVVALIAGLTLFIGGPVIAEMKVMATDLPGRYDQIKNDWLAGSWIQRTVAISIPDLNNLIQITTGGQWNAYLQNILGMTLGSLDLVSKIALIFVLSIYWSADQEHFKRLWLSLLPPEYRIRWRDVWQNIEKDIGAYLRSELIQSLLTVIILGVGYQLIGLKYPILLAVIGAVGWLIVWFGGLVAVIPALFAGLTISPFVGLLASIFTILVLSILEFVVEPRLFNRKRLSSLLVVIMVLIMIKQFGIIGFLIAPPLSSAIQIFSGKLFRPTTAKSTITLEPPPMVQIDILRERLTNVQTMIAERTDASAPEIINLVERLKELIDRAEQEGQLID